MPSYLCSTFAAVSASYAKATRNPFAPYGVAPSMDDTDMDSAYDSDSECSSSASERDMTPPGDDHRPSVANVAQIEDVTTESIRLVLTHSRTGAVPTTPSELADQLEQLTLKTTKGKKDPKLQASVEGLIGKMTAMTIGNGHRAHAPIYHARSPPAAAASSPHTLIQYTWYPPPEPTPLPDLPSLLSATYKRTAANLSPESFTECFQRAVKEQQLLRYQTEEATPARRVKAITVNKAGAPVGRRAECIVASATRKGKRVALPSMVVPEKVSATGEESILQWARVCVEDGKLQPAKATPGGRKGSAVMSRDVRRGAAAPYS